LKDRLVDYHKWGIRLTITQTSLTSLFKLNQMEKYNHSLTPQQNRIESLIASKAARVTDIPALLRCVNDMKEHIKAIQHYAGTDYSKHLFEHADNIIESIEKRI
jgi:hypothetical protein